MAKREKIYHIIAISIVVISMGALFLCYPYCLRRLIEGIRDLGISFAHYFHKVFKNLFKEEFSLPLHFLSLPDKYYNDYLPFDVDELLRKAEAFFPALFEKDAFLLYLNFLAVNIVNTSNFMVLGVGVIACLIPLFKTIFYAKNNDYNKDTKPLVFYKKHIEKYGKIAIEEVKRFFVFFLSKKYYLIPSFVVWGINLNVFSIVIGALTFYIYFCTTLAFLNLPVQAVRLIVDLLIMFNCANVIFWLWLGYKIIDKIRRNIGYERLDHHENCNRGFIKERPIFSMVCGTMGLGKTQFVTDMGISQGIMFRGDALHDLQEAQMKFPNFPWIILEKDFEKQVDKGKIKDIFTVRAWVKKKRRAFEKSPALSKVFEYDYTKYSMYFDSGLKIEYLWEVIAYYVELYMIYIMDSSLIIANYSIRDDSYIYDEGNFPLWDTELFRRSSASIEEHSRYAHILNYDSVRLGRKLVEANENMLARIGVYVMTEIGKERGNKVELEGKKKDANETNQKNDLFDYWLKLIRHLVTIHFTPYAKIFTDEQRPDSLGANARQLGDIIWIDEKSKQYITMPFFLLGDLFYDTVYKAFLSMKLKYRYFRGDNTLLMYLLNNLMYKFNKHYTQIYNIFGTYDLSLTVQSGRMDKEGKEYKYYISTKKIYSDRYSTDCYSDVFDEVSKDFPYFIDDIETYKSTKATYEEMKKQNSYMFNDLCEFTGVNK